MSRRGAVVDCHNHYVDPVWGSRPGPSSKVEDVRARELAERLAVLDRRGVDAAVIIAEHSYLRPAGLADTRQVNDGVAAYAFLRPDRFIGAVGVVEPLYGERGLSEIDRCKELGLAGISFHCRFQGVSVDSRWVRRYLSRMGEIGLLPFVHCNGESPEEALWKLDLMARDLPGLPMVILDAFSTFEQCRLVPHVAAAHPLLVFDTALAASIGAVVSTVRAAGAGSVVYGSCLYSRTGAYPLGDPLPEILASDLDAGTKAAIIGGTINRLLGRTTAVT
jgi:predicted TIM-barrel fold metal-dependent hydrolase